MIPELDAALQAFAARPHPLHLRGHVKHYAWGGHQVIPGSLGFANPEERPFAELWIGAHPAGPAEAELHGHTVRLDQLLRRHGDAILGPGSTEHFPDGLPYLLKVLDVRGMLSIQAHPTREQAEDGYRREERAGIALDDPNRSYRDRNHKPEAHVAVTEFHLLHGFRPLEEIDETLSRVPELRVMMPDFDHRLRAARGDEERRRQLAAELYERAMTLPQPEVDKALAPLLGRLLPRYQSGQLGRGDPDFWAARAAIELPLPGGHTDRGIFSIYLLNLVRLLPGEGTYQPAGALHAYLEGVTVEVMANSDNVLRGGLTPKHVDVEELLRTLRFDCGAPPVLRGEAVSPTERTYPTPAAEFRLGRIAVDADRPHRSSGPNGADCLVVLEGEASLEAAGALLALPRGGCALVPSGVAYTLTSPSSALLFRASVPE
jgi:mannose-6-phosphate isomerase